MLVSEDSAIAASKQAYVEMLKPYAQQGKIDNDPALKDRVYRITGRLIAQAIKMRPETGDWDWSIKIIDDPETVNAWAMAGGKMALYTGLVNKIKPTDDELAQVLGHEIAHALAKHSAEKMSVAMASSIGVVAVGVVADRKGLARSGPAITGGGAAQRRKGRRGRSHLLAGPGTESGKRLVFVWLNAEPPCPGQGRTGRSGRKEIPQSLETVECDIEGFAFH